MIGLKEVGFYESRGESRLGGANLQDLISDAPQQDEDRIVAYLESGLCLWACGGAERDILDPQSGQLLDQDVLIDGTWKWPAYLAYYVKHYHLRLPLDFVAYMIANNWIVPTELDWKAYLPASPKS